MARQHARQGNLADGSWSSATTAGRRFHGLRRQYLGLRRAASVHHGPIAPRQNRRRYRDDGRAGRARGTSGLTAGILASARQHATRLRFAHHHRGIIDIRPSV